MTEVWDIYDNNRIKTDRTHMRGTKMIEGDNILIAMVLIFNTKGEMLIQQRQNHLTWLPGKWTMTAGGAVLSGETSADAAERELFEELGIKMKFAGQRPNFAMTNETAFMDYFLVRMDIDTAYVSVPNNEAQAVKWASKDDMLTMVENGNCAPYKRSFVEFCFDMGRGYGVLED